MCIHNKKEIVPLFENINKNKGTVHLFENINKNKETVHIFENTNKNKETVQIFENINKNKETVQILCGKTCNTQNNCLFDVPGRLLSSKEQAAQNTLRLRRQNAG